MTAEAFAAKVQKWGAIDKALRANLARMIRAYPASISSVRIETGKPVMLSMQSGDSVAFEDGITDKSFDQRLETCDVFEMLFDYYPPNLSFESWPENLDPGRYRSSPFFKAVYGAEPQAVEANLVKVTFCGRTISFNKQNGAAAALVAAGKEIQAAADKDPALRPYLEALGGTFAWRPIAGTQQLSAHCFGIAIDLNPDLGGYWRWDKGDKGSMRRRFAYPAAIISIFERHGFIWGGKWYHFDLMHFEFRPEFNGSNPFLGN
jgi:hypothetical protein